MTYIEEVLQRQPRHARAIYLLAVQHAELGLTQRAISGIKAALSIDPDLEIARFQLGLLLMFDKNEPREAKSYLERLAGSENRALRAYSQAMIAIADNEPAVARQKLAIGLSESSPDSPLSALMRRLFERMSNGMVLPNASEVTSQRSLAACPPCRCPRLYWMRCYYVHCRILPRATPSFRAGSSRSGAARIASSGDARATPSSGRARTRCRSALPGAASSTATSTAARSLSTTTTS